MSERKELDMETTVIKKKLSPIGVAGFVLSLCSIALCWTGIIGVILAALAMGFKLKARKQLTPYYNFFDYVYYGKIKKKLDVSGVDDRAKFCWIAQIAAWIGLLLSCIYLVGHIILLVLMCLQ